MRVSSVPILLVAVMALSGCGTATYTHDITIDDPSGRLGPGPVDVSIFDHDMGSSMEWARKTMGPASKEAPYKTTFVTTRVRTVLSEDLPGQVVVAIAIPAYETRGYFLASIAPDPAAEKTIVAPVVMFGRDPAAEAVAPLAVHYTSQPGDRGWQIGIRVEIPEGR